MENLTTELIHQLASTQFDVHQVTVAEMALSTKELWAASGSDTQGVCSACGLLLLSAALPLVQLLSRMGVVDGTGSDGDWLLHAG